jgi:5-deoxy-glucuronate isomerase
MSDHGARTWHLPAGTAGDDRAAVSVGPPAPGWEYTALYVVEIPPGDEQRWHTGAMEMLALPLAGSFTVSCDGVSFPLSGRAGVFDGVTDFAYLPREATAVISSRHGGRLAFPAAVCQARREPRYVPAEAVHVEVRGAGACSRQVHNFAMPGTFDHPERLLACEVLTPGGNWSSYPPHKHDEDRPGESRLEEIYYFEVAGGAGVGYQRVYGPGIDVLAEVRTGDVVLVPHGWHGPSMAAPGYDLYYLNVMAGPSAERAWLIRDDPDHAWIRDTWTGQPVDPRLPMSGGRQ